ncbi:serine acetyltransferase [Azospirillaceae bacterium]
MKHMATALTTPRIVISDDCVGLSKEEYRVWKNLRIEAMRVATNEKCLSRLIDETILTHNDFSSALAVLLSRKLGNGAVSTNELEELVLTATDHDPGILRKTFLDLRAIVERDPAADDYLTPFLYFKGFHALQWQRISHWLWQRGRFAFARFLQSRASEVFAVDIHPAVPIGHGVFIDHATGLVVGETAVIGNDVSILQGVTLGGTGKENGDRHPKVRDGVLLAAGAKVLGNIEIGFRAKVGAGSVVLKNVPACATVAGVPARIVGWCRDTVPALAMDQSFPEPDYSI